MHPKHLTTALILALATTAAGCFNLNIGGPVTFKCDPGEGEKACPEGYSCLEDKEARPDDGKQRQGMCHRQCKSAKDCGGESGWDCIKGLCQPRDVPPPDGPPITDSDMGTTPPVGCFDHSLVGSLSPAMGIVFDIVLDQDNAPQVIYINADGQVARATRGPTGIWGSLTSSGNTTADFLTATIDRNNNLHVVYANQVGPIQHCFGPAADPTTCDTPQSVGVDGLGSGSTHGLDINHADGASGNLVAVLAVSATVASKENLVYVGIRDKGGVPEHSWICSIEHDYEMTHPRIAMAAGYTFISAYVNESLAQRHMVWRFEPDVKPDSFECTSKRSMQAVLNPHESGMALAATQGLTDTPALAHMARAADNKGEERLEYLGWNGKTTDIPKVDVAYTGPFVFRSVDLVMAGPLPVVSAMVAPASPAPPTPPQVWVLQGEWTPLGDTPADPALQTLGMHTRMATRSPSSVIHLVHDGLDGASQPVLFYMQCRF